LIDDGARLAIDTLAAFLALGGCDRHLLQSLHNRLERIPQALHLPVQPRVRPVACRRKFFFEILDRNIAAASAKAVGKNMAQSTCKQVLDAGNVLVQRPVRNAPKWVSLRRKKASLPCFLAVTREFNSQTSLVH